MPPSLSTVHGLLIAATAALASCATPLRPSGGPEDRTPPQLVASVPAAGAVRVTDRRLVLTFSERVDEAALRRALTVVPEPARPPAVRVRGREVEITLPDSLQPDVTYVVTLGTELRDLHGAALPAPITLAFATGAQIDRGRIAGAVRDPATGRGVAGLAVLAYRLPADSAAALPDPRTAAPDYRSQTGTDGAFTLAYLRPGPYFVAAVADRNRNGRADAGEPFAAPPAPRLAAVEPEATTDDGRRTTDSTSAPLPSPTPTSPHAFLLARADTTGPALRQARARTPRLLAVRFDEGVQLASDEAPWTVEDSASGRAVPLDAAWVRPEDAREILATTAAPLAPARYRLRLAPGAVRDSAGNAAPPAAAAFTAPAAPDTARARFAGFLPDARVAADSAFTLRPGERAGVRFTLPLDSAEARARLAVRAPDGARLPFRLVADDAVTYRIAVEAPAFVVAAGDTARSPSRACRRAPTASASSSTATATGRGTAARSRPTPRPSRSGGSPRPSASAPAGTPTSARCGSTAPRCGVRAGSENRGSRMEDREPGESRWECYPPSPILDLPSSPPVLDPILDAAAMREADRRTIAEAGLPGRVLMETAGRAACDAAEAEFGPVAGKEVVVLCGRGNNGGDGLVVARVLHARGARVRAFTTGDPATEDSAANLKALEAVRDDRLTVQPLDDARPLGALRPDLVVDALLGTGATGDLRAPLDALCAWTNRQPAPVVALDVPTGLDADTGRAADDAVRAALTVTFGALKPGLLLGAGPALTRRVGVAEIGIPRAYLEEGATAWRASDAWVTETLPVRPPDAHKYTAGRVAAVAGSRAFTGAAALATGAAYRAGAGAVVCCTPRSAQPTLDVLRPEVMVDALPETDEGTLALMGYDEVMDRLAEADAVLLGCGLGKVTETQRLVRALLRRIEAPTVLDADGLNAFEGHAEKLAEAKAPLVLTPHTGELARLLGEDPDLSDRLALVRALAARWNAVLLLKGMPSVVGAPDGRVFVGPPPQPALATAGTGDVLAGTVAGLLAQGMAPAEAAVAALHLGTAAAERFSATRGAASLVAGDLLDELPFVLRERFGRATG